MRLVPARSYRHCLPITPSGVHLLPHSLCILPIMCDEQRALATRLAKCSKRGVNVTVRHFAQVRRAHVALANTTDGLASDSLWRYP